VTQTERSRLLFLLDALRAAPHKAAKLIAVVEREDASAEFRAALAQLGRSSNVAQSTAEMRESLR
jgi:hypothetical protein